MPGSLQAPQRRKATAYLRLAACVQKTEIRTHPFRKRRPVQTLIPREDGRNMAQRRRTV